MLLTRIRAVLLLPLHRYAEHVISPGAGRDRSAAATGPPATRYRADKVFTRATTSLAKWLAGCLIWSVAWPYILHFFTRVAWTPHHEPVTKALAQAIFPPHYQIELYFIIAVTAIVALGTGAYMMWDLLHAEHSKTPLDYIVAAAAGIVMAALMAALVLFWLVVCPFLAGTLLNLIHGHPLLAPGPGLR